MCSSKMYVLTFTLPSEVFFQVYFQCQFLSLQQSPIYLVSMHASVSQGEYSK